jgi:hypothetical protein
MEKTYLTTEELARRIKYDARTIRERLMDSVLLWEVVERDIGVASTKAAYAPMQHTQARMATLHG